MPTTDYSPNEHARFIADQAKAGTPLTLGEAFVIGMLGEVLTQLSNLAKQIGALSMSTQADADQLAQQIRDNTTAVQNWASNVQAILTSVEAALTAAQNASGVDLSAAQSALADAQNVVASLPVEVDPTAPADPDAPVEPPVPSE